MSLKQNQKLSSEQKQQILARFTRDLTNLAEKGDLDPVIGRDKEIRRMIQVLARRTKNNPVLIGEPGVGKTAMAEGLAHRVINKDVPEILMGKKVLCLDMAALVAGSVYRGQFESRLKNLIQIVEESQGQIILFIDELHTLVGAGKLDGAMDAGQILKPSLARGELRVIGATTLDEYRKFIEKDRALERRFQVVLVEEPSVEDAIAILRGLKQKYEVHHGIRIQDVALVQAVKLSHRYITDRFLPDKAIDLMDEAASHLSIEVNSIPTDLDEIQRKIMQLKIEKQALSKEKDSASNERLKVVEKEMAHLENKNQELSQIWRRERRQISDLKNVKKEIEKLKIEIDQAGRQGHLEKAAELKYGKLPELRGKLEQLEKTTLKDKKILLKEEVSPDEVAQVVSHWTGIPVDRISKEQSQKLLNLEKILKKKVVGQDHALKIVSQAIRRSRAGMSDPQKPIGVFMFLGPTGVGKTETAKALSQFLFDSKKMMIRIDMSEYVEKHSVYRMIGAPPGYVGHEEGGQLTEYVRRHPYSVILLDEIEKAHPDVFHTLLQVFDEGRLTDGQGRTVNFKNCVIIMTSNLGSSELSNHQTKLDRKKEKVMETLHTCFRPEFLNRVDEFIFFNPLDSKTVREILQLQLHLVNERLKKQDIHLEFSKEAIDYLVRKGFDPVFGARSLKRMIETCVLNPMAQDLIAQKIKPGHVIEVRANDLNLEFHKKLIQKIA